MSKKRKVLLGVLAVLLVAVVYFFFSPAESALAPKCPFKMLTGYDCPGCGSQRFIHSMLHLRFGDAFRYNAMLFLMMPYLVVLVFAYFNRERYRRLYHILNCKWGVVAPFALLAVWGVVRNIFGW